MRLVLLLRDPVAQLDAMLAQGMPFFSAPNDREVGLTAVVRTYDGMNF